MPEAILNHIVGKLLGKSWKWQYLLVGTLGDGCQVGEHVNLVLAVDALLASRQHNLLQLLAHHLECDLLRIHRQQLVL